LPFPTHPQNQLKQLRLIQLISKLWPLSKTAAHKHGACSAKLSSSSLQLAFRQAGTQRLAGHVSTGIFHPIVPQKFRKYIFSHFHNISHPGRLASQRMASSRFVWTGLDTDITAWSRACLHCQQAKIHHHTRLQ
jgi:hypothetical protein